MKQPFQIGDQVVFYNEYMTQHSFGMTNIKRTHLHKGTVLTVTNVEIRPRTQSYFAVFCQGPDDEFDLAYHHESLRLVDMRTEDEIYLDNLLRGVR